MNQIHCWNHRKYRGLDAPSLDCATCCDIFIDKILRENEQIKPSGPIDLQKKVIKKRLERVNKQTKHWLSVK